MSVDVACPSRIFVPCSSHPGSSVTSSPATILIIAGFSGTLFTMGCSADSSKGGAGTSSVDSGTSGDGGSGAGSSDGDGSSPDSDGDGVPDDEDCAPDDPSISPDASEICDGVDNNCDELVDDEDPALDTSTGSEWFADADGDGFGDPTSPTVACEQPPGTVADNSDCDDGDAAVNPDAAEVPNDGIDNDCRSSTIDDIGGGTFFSTDAATVIQGSADPVSTPGRLLLDGDFDGDGAADVVTGTHGTERVLAFWSQPSARFLELDEADATMDGLRSTTGWLLAAEAEDANADGFADILVGVPGASAEGGNGVVYLVQGPLTGSIDASADWTTKVTHTVSSQQFASDVDFFPDVDGDGLPEALVSDKADDPDDGALYIISSTTTGDLDTSAAMTRIVDLTAYSFHADGTAAPDLNGDGFADLVVSDWVTASARTYVFFGPVTSDRTAESPDQVIQVAGGFSGVQAGDFTGDGIPDLAISSVSSSSGSTGANDHVFVFDGADTSTPERSTDDAVATLNDAEVRGFGSSLDSLDYDGSGVADLLVGAPDADTVGRFNGVGYLFLGPLSGTVSPESALVSIEGVANTEYFGSSVRATDDLDGDGQPDFWVGARGYRFDEFPVGAAMLFHSSDL